MHQRTITDGVHWVGAIDWNRRLFDALIPLPDGTSYNAYLIEGKTKTALLDTVDPALETELLDKLDGVATIDYVVSHHTEQDHSGTLPTILARYPEAVVLCSAKAESMLVEHLELDPERLQVVSDGETLDLGGKTLTFIYTPWVHWPETMVTYLHEDAILFSCDFFGSHLATSRLYAGSDPYVLEAAKRYYAEIMMPFRSVIRSNLNKLDAMTVNTIAPSHGPLYDQPDTILAAYADWVSDHVENRVVMPYVSMHGSTAAMVEYLMSALVDQGIEVEPFELSTTDIGKLAMALVDAQTLVIGTPTVHVGPHPTVYSAAHLANALRPKVRYAGIIGSYGWGTRAVDQLTQLIPNLKVDVLGTVICKGYPRQEAYQELDVLAEAITAKHEQS